MHNESIEKALRNPCPREKERKSSVIAKTSQIKVVARPTVTYVSASPPATAARPVAFELFIPMNE